MSVNKIEGTIEWEKKRIVLPPSESELIYMVLSVDEKTTE